MVSPLTVFTVVGARPQFVKAAMVSRALKARGILEVLVHTGQHFDPEMSDVFFEELEMSPPSHHLHLGGGHQGEMTGKMLIALERLMLEVKPDWVLVYGDTNSTLAAALAASKLHIPVAHVEAGMRSFNRKMPEEVNRVLVDHLSSLLFTPSEAPVALLKSEGITTGVHVVGDIMMDAVLHFKDTLDHQAILRQQGLSPNHYLLVTLHRAENTDDPLLLAQWIQEISRLGQQHKVFFPMHPRTRKAIQHFGLEVDPRLIQISPPLTYGHTLSLLANAKALLTDSGGMQKEAYYLEVPCLTLRQETEWVETLDTGWNTLVKTPEQLPGLLANALTKTYAPTVPLYGTGKTAQAIVEQLKG